MLIISSFAARADSTGPMILTARGDRPGTPKTWILHLYLLESDIRLAPLDPIIHEQGPSGTSNRMVVGELNIRFRS
jgi:hypothetical protein